MPIGKNIPHGKVSIAHSKLAAPAAYKFVVGVNGYSLTFPSPVVSSENDWSFWVYPAPATLTPAQARALWSASAAPAAQRTFDPDLNDNTIPAKPAPGT